MPKDFVRMTTRSSNFANKAKQQYEEIKQAAMERKKRLAAQAMAERDMEAEKCCGRLRDCG